MSYDPPAAPAASPALVSVTLSTVSAFSSPAAVKLDAVKGVPYTFVSLPAVMVRLDGVMWSALPVNASEELSVATSVPIPIAYDPTFDPASRDSPPESAVASVSPFWNPVATKDSPGSGDP